MNARIEDEFTVNILLTTFDLFEISDKIKAVWVHSPALNPIKVWDKLGKPRMIDKYVAFDVEGLTKEEEEKFMSNPNFLNMQTFSAYPGKIRFRFKHLDHVKVP